MKAAIWKLRLMSNSASRRHPMVDLQSPSPCRHALPAYSCAPWTFVLFLQCKRFPNNIGGSRRVWLQPSNGGLFARPALEGRRGVKQQLDPITTLVEPFEPQDFPTAHRSHRHVYSLTPRRSFGAGQSNKHTGRGQICISMWSAAHSDARARQLHPCHRRAHPSGCHRNCGGGERSGRGGALPFAQSGPRQYVVRYAPRRARSGRHGRARVRHVGVRSSAAGWTLLRISTRITRRTLWTSIRSPLTAPPHTPRAGSRYRTPRYSRSGGAAGSDQPGAHGAPPHQPRGHPGCRAKRARARARTRPKTGTRRHLPVCGPAPRAIGGGTCAHAPARHLGPGTG